ncbi:Asp-tRNA(Asn)/Glu-tRNA(Gln) amidotransferase subunit GatB [Pyrolobus fumarii]
MVPLALRGCGWCPRPGNQVLPSHDDVKIGLEIHVQLTRLKTKLFCSCSADYRGAPPNTHVCPVCLGLPGSLPVVNEEALKLAIMTCLALNGKVARELRFVRKHYFYPDLPKSYQISQYDGPGGEPICKGGWVEYEYKGERRRARIRRINLEEDPGRIVLPGAVSPRLAPYVLVDYNRSGVALLEIVTEPDFREPGEARAFLEKLRSILEHLEVCDCGLEGALRVDANVSVGGGARVEIKNIGSIRDVERALAYEIARQKKLLEAGGTVRRETRHWDPVRRVTYTARAKEYEEDYRYMPDPNLPPIPIPESLVEKIRAEMPELPDQRLERMTRQYGIPAHIVRQMLVWKKLADFYEDVVKLYPENPSRTAAFLVNDMLGWLKESDLAELYTRVKPEHVAKLMRMLDEGKISLRQAKELIKPLLETGEDPEKLAEKLGMTRITDESYLRQVVEKVIRENPKAVKDALANPKAVNYLVGLVMKETRGRADPKLARKLLEEKLEEMRKANQ